jgi:ribosomal protein S18 acetylase RimI-like enzyme
VTQNFELRLAAAADLAAVEALIVDAYSAWIERIGRKPGPMLDDYARLIAEGRVTLALRQGALVGLVVLVPQGDAMLLDNVAVATAARGMGVGASLMRHAEDEARKIERSTLRLYTHALMRENIALYARNGWRETKRVTERGFDRVYMEKQIPVHATTQEIAK